VATNLVIFLRNTWQNFIQNFQIFMQNL